MWAEVPPDWDPVLDALDSALRHPERRAETPTLELVSVLHEIEAWTAAGRDAADGRATQDWQSLKSEMAEIIAHPPYGEHLGALLDSDLRKLRSELDHGRQGKAVGAMAHSVLELLSQRDALVAAWDDLVKAAQSLSRDVMRFRRRRNELLGIAELQGYPLGSFGTPYRVIGILADQAAYIKPALDHFHELTNTRNESSDRLYGLPKAKRLALARQQWLTLDSSESNVVWLTYDCASLEVGEAKFGQVTFYSGWYLSNLVTSPERHCELPEEIRPEKWATDWTPENEFGVTYARVDLGATHATRAIADAVALTTAILDGFGSSGDRTGWIRRPQVQHYSASSRTTASYGNNKSSTWQTDPTGTFLEENQLPSAGPFIMDNDFRRLLRAQSALRVAKSESSTQAISAAVELIELVKTLASGPTPEWWTFSSSQFRQSYILGDALDRLVNTALGVDRIETLRWIEDESVDRVQQILAGFTSPDRDNLIQIHLDRICATYPELLDLLHPDSLVHADLSEASKILDVSKAGRQLDRIGKEFDLKLDRMKRCRNAISHGWPIDAHVAEDTAAFADRLARIVFRTYLSGSTAGSATPTQEVDAERRRSEKRVAEIVENGFQLARS